MTVCSDIADYEWLTGEEACGLLNELAEDSGPLHTAVARLRAHFSRERTHLLIDQVELRRRAVAKFTRAQSMFFTRVGLEQATDEWVAAYKAARFASQRAGSSPTPAVADLCCGIGGDLLGLTGQGPAVGVDRDLIAAHFAAVNTGTVVHMADVERFDVADFAAWHIDPDRRPGGRRTTSVQFCQPDAAFIEQLLARAPHAGIKLAPATNVPEHWVEQCELEWISRNRECRQLVAWHGDLAQAPGRRRATVLVGANGVASRTVIGLANQPIPIAEHVDRYIFDIDPAVLAAGLKGVLAAEHSLCALGAGPTYLTGPRPNNDDALASFEVADVLPLKTHQLARYLGERAIGQLEIKKRGVDIDPEKLRRDLKLRGDNSTTLLITHFAGRPIAILAHRASPTPTRPIKPLLESKTSQPSD
ncbi:MAG: hypothetical protein WD738_24335 [Pirellulales bacterium]